MSAPRLMGVVALLGAATLACTMSERTSGDAPTVGEGRGDPPTSAPAPAKEAPAISGDLGPLRRALLSDGDACYRERPAYCITDPDFVDPILRELVARSADGVAPATDDEARALARRVRGRFANQQMDTPEARAKVEAAIRAWWDNPEVIRDGRVVRADLGVTPGSLERSGRAGWNVVRSDLVVEGELDGKVAASRLTALKQAYPDAVTWAVEVEVPMGAGGFLHQEVQYQSGRDRIIVRRKDASNQAWFTPKLGGDLSAYASGASSLSTGELESCKLKDAIWGVDPDCPR